ncbi:MAG TPA: phospholipase D family protein [Casimicrobiaceae bacterium]|jgi:phosphatidylserine/phosphatidylglycerophosphate/cardiolipin synthase-like enzyme
MTSWSKRIACSVALGLLATLGAAGAREIVPAPHATYEVLFTPGDAIDARLADLLSGARTEVLMNAFSFTNRRIGRALAAASARGVRVEIVADRGQTLDSPGSVVPALARQGIAVWLDGNFAAAHNKVIIIDGASAQGAVVTGSYNYTGAAQSRNAENILIIRHDPALALQYRANFIRLRDRAARYDGEVGLRR